MAKGKTKRGRRLPRGVHAQVAPPGYRMSERDDQRSRPRAGKHPGSAPMRSESPEADD